MYQPIFLPLGGQSQSQIYDFPCSGCVHSRHPDSFGIEVVTEPPPSWRFQTPLVQCPKSVMCEFWCGGIDRNSDLWWSWMQVESIDLRCLYIFIMLILISFDVSKPALMSDKFSRSQDEAEEKRRNHRGQSLQPGLSLDEQGVPGICSGETIPTAFSTHTFTMQ